MSKFFATFLVVMAVIFSVRSDPPTAAPATIAATAINSLGIDLLHQIAHTDANALLSPYSIETALAMTYAGTDGKTKDEMARVLHFQGDGTQVAGEFATLEGLIDALVQRSAEEAEQIKKDDGKMEPITLEVANRLFGQQGYDFRPAFLNLLKTQYNAPFQPMDFVHGAAGATKTINDWVEQKTQRRIRGLIPGGALDKYTRLVLVNALYLKAPWEEPFSEGATKPFPFRVRGGAATMVPTMNIQKSFGYAKSAGLTLVSLPYGMGELSFLIILPDDTNGLAKVEAGLTAAKMVEWVSLPGRLMNLHLPKFKIEPSALSLGNALQKLGMATAFDLPRGSANFAGIAPRRLPNDYLYISDVFHKTFLSLDEKGAEAAAATAVIMPVPMGIVMDPPKPIEVRVDHPFIFAIQHRASGACLFLGHVVDPR